MPSPRATGLGKLAPQPLVRGQGREQACNSWGVGSASSVPPPHSLRLGTLVLVAAPADGLGPLLVVTQVPLYHVVVSAAPAAIFGELDTCGECGLPRGWSCQALTALPGALGTVSSGDPGGPAPPLYALAHLLPAAV